MQPLTPAHGKEKWTVLFYGGGTNDLQPSIRKAWEQVQEQEVPENVDLFVRHFDAEGHLQEARFEGGGESTVSSPSEQPVNSGSGQTFEDFLLQGMERFPADHYLVVVSSHGMGAGGVVTDTVAKDRLTLQEVKNGMQRAALANGRPLDVVLFDACQMGAMEMAVSLQGSARTMVASLDNVGNSGYHLPTLIDEVSKARDAEDLARSLVSNAEPQQQASFRTLSAIDLTKMKPFLSAFQDWSQGVLELGPDDRKALRTIFENARRNGNAPETQQTFDFIAEDLLSQYPVDSGLLDAWISGTRPGPGMALAPFLTDILESGGPAGLRQSTDRLLEAHDALLQAHRSDTKEAVGLTVHAPMENPPGPLYDQTDGPLPELDRTGWEAAYNSLLPEGEKLPRKETWLEEELGPMLPKKA